MSRVTLSARLIEELQKLSRPADLCDESGRVVGQFVPNGSALILEPLSPELSPEELKQRKKTGKWYTTAQVLAKLQGE